MKKAPLYPKDDSVGAVNTNVPFIKKIVPKGFAERF
jgi:hypothetical protein